VAEFEYTDSPTQEGIGLEPTHLPAFLRRQIALAVLLTACLVLYDPSNCIETQAELI